MIDITGVKIREMFVHRVGNSLRNEGVIYSEDAQQIATRDELPLIQFLFGHSERLNAYTFTHSVKPELNAIRAVADGVSGKDASLQQASTAIADHLYSVSDHPRVKAGNVFVAIFDGIRYAQKVHSFLGVFKSDSVNDFIQVEVKDGKASLRVEQGASVSSLDKVGLVRFSKKSETAQVLAASARGEDAAFWIERFLQVAPAASSKATTKACLDICRSFVTEASGELDLSERMLFLNRTLRFFEDSEKYDEESFSSVFTSKAQENAFKQFRDQRTTSGKDSIPQQFEIEKAVVRKERTKFEKNVKLDENIEIRLRFTTPNEMSERVEQGFDAEKGMAFYKLYYPKTN